MKHHPNQTMLKLWEECLRPIRRDLTSSTRIGKAQYRVKAPFGKLFILRLDRLHLLMLFLFLPNRNAFASINKRIVLTQPTVILVSYDGFRWDYMEKDLNLFQVMASKRNTFSIPLLPRHSRIISH